MQYLKEFLSGKSDKQVEKKRDLHQVLMFSRFFWFHSFSVSKMMNGYGYRIRENKLYWNQFLLRCHIFAILFNLAPKCIIEHVSYSSSTNFQNLLDCLLFSCTCPKFWYQIRLCIGITSFDWNKWTRIT